MLQSKLFTKTRKEAPADEVAKNAQLLIRAGYVYKEMAGVYDYLPLGLRVLNNVNRVIREEMNAVGGQEAFLSTLQDKGIWEATGRWSDEVVDNWFKTKLKSGSEAGLGFTHEEPLTNLMTNYISSYRDLPCAVYQIQTKFRNEERAKSGVMRGREFLMKDMYSFAKDEKEHEAFYDKAANAYKKIFDRLGIGDKTYMTYATGGTFSKFSHEFQTVTDAGEDTIYIDEKGKRAVNKEVYTDEILGGLGLKKEDLTEAKAVEVGNIFTLGTKFSDAFKLEYVDETGEKKPVFMGCYGIGPGRVMGTLVELLSDDKGLVWPEEVAPYSVHLVSLGGTEVDKRAKEIHDDLESEGVEVLFDDRDLRAGEKFADSDLIGIPWRIVVSEKNMREGMLELKYRKTGEIEHVPESELLNDKVLGRFKK